MFPVVEILIFEVKSDPDIAEVESVMVLPDTAVDKIPEPDKVIVPPSDTDPDPDPPDKVIAELVRDELPMFESVLVSPEIVLLVKV